MSIMSTTAGRAFFDSTYRGFAENARRQVRRETYEHNFGQTSWLALDEWRMFGRCLGAGPGRTVLDVACGSGGPALQLVRDTGVAVVGVDVHADAIVTASSAARTSALEALARFEQADAEGPLPFPDATFDAVVCIDAVTHFADRAAVIADWRRVLKPGGMLLYTDPVIVSGIVSRDELEERASVGYFNFTPPGENERLIISAGLELVRTEDLTDSVARIAASWHAARMRHRHALVDDEGADVFEATQRYLSTAAKLARERRLSRHVFIGRVRGG